MRELFRGDCRRTTGRGAAPRLLPLLLLLTQEWILPPTTMMMTTTTAWTMIRPMPRRGYSTIGSMMQRHQQRVWLLAAEQNSALDSNNGGIVTATDDFLNKDVVDEDGKDEDGVDDVTYYSPNVPLGESRWSSEESIIPTDENVVLGGGDSTNEYSFFDEAVITVRAGSGGQGSATFKKSKVGQDGLADGGNGGRGGNVWLVTDASLNTLAGLTNAWRPNSFGGAGAAAATTVQPPKNFRAENGGDGGRMYNNGRFGGDVIIRVPPGTVVQEQIFDKETGELLRTVDLGTLAAGDGNEEQHHDGERFSYSSKSLGSSESRILVARGGDGGEGSAAAGKHRGVRRPREGSRGGQRKILMLTLKIVADVALVGVPNAGKSTFLAAVTRAKPKIANYPFTTIIPNLGVWIPQADVHKSNEHALDKGAGSDGLVLCDVPGLIAGAARGVGLGHAFLRHVERCHVIVHLLDATSNDPVADFEMLNKEVVQYGTGQLAAMPQVVVVNKIDAFEEGVTGNSWEKGLQVRWSREKLEERLRETMPHTRLMWMSAKEREGVDDLMKRLAAFVKKVKNSKDAEIS